MSYGKGCLEGLTSIPISIEIGSCQSGIGWSRKLLWFPYGKGCFEGFWKCMYNGLWGKYM